VLGHKVLSQPVDDDKMTPRGPAAVKFACGQLDYRNGEPIRPQLQNFPQHARNGGSGS